MIPVTSTIENDFKSNVLNVEYLVALYLDVIESHPNIYVSNKKQMFDSDAEGVVYYEDIDLKVSKISEKIDLKTKKTQLSNVTITLSNFPIQNTRFSEHLNNALGKNVSIHLKTQGCETISDCVKIAELKITRVNHDANKVVINAEDVESEKFLIDLPLERHILKTNISTFENYNNRPTPILYGHLKSAPAIIYIENMAEETYFKNNMIKVIPDISYFSEGKEIRGIKQFHEVIENGWYDRVWDQDSLQVII